ncbi:MAG: TonB-dependent receptor [Nitrospiraceae bacterium]
MSASVVAIGVTCWVAVLSTDASSAETPQGVGPLRVTEEVMGGAGAQIVHESGEVEKVSLPEIYVTTAVTATRTARELDQISQSVSVLTRERIESRNARSVQELLEEVPGVSFSRAGGLGGQVVMRGFNSNVPRLLMLVDGDRFRGRNTLEYNLFDPNQIERIEVIRGPSSTMYGPDAMVGVVNIITRQAKGESSGPFRLVPRLRSLDYNSVNNLRGTRGEVEVLGHGIDGLVGVSWRQADDYQSPLGRIQNSDFTQWHADLRLGYSLLPGHRIELTGKFADVESGRAGGIGAAPGVPLVRQREDPLRESFGKLAYQGRLDALGLERIEASIYGRALDSRLTSANRTQANRLVESSNLVAGPTVIGGKVFGVKRWTQGTLTVGTDWFRESRRGALSESQTTNVNASGQVTSVTQQPLTQNAPDATQTDVGLFLHHDWDPSPKLTLSTGGRLDYIRTTSNTSPVLAPQLQEAYERGRENTEVPLTGAIGLIYRPWDWLHFTANVGRAFRAPSTVESFGSSRQGTGFNVPNPDLKSEEGVTYEVGTRLRLPIVQASVTMFRSDYHNFIVRQPITFAGLPSFQNQNAGRARMDGVEFDATWAVTPGCEVRTNAAYLQGSDPSTGRPLSYVPPFNGLLGVRYILPEKGLYLEGTVKGSLRKDRIDGALERETAGYVALNLYAGIDLWTVSPWFPDMRLRLALENILNQAYRHATTVEDIRFPGSNTNPLVEPGRAFSIALTSRF